LLLGLFGVLRGASGDIFIGGKKTAISSPSAAKSPEIGMALIP
jgi:ribose transport system ATP-binding protein